MKVPYFGRLLTAMITPFASDGSVDYAAAAKFTGYLLEHGSDALVVTGSTGEAATMSAEEKIKLYKTVIEASKGKVPVIAGTGTNSTQSTIEATKAAEEAGVDGFLVVGPYYNKPTQEGYYRHFAAVAQAVSKPVIVYNVPGRTGSNIAPATVARLAADFDNIVAIKEAAGNVAQVAELYSVLPEDFTIYSGDDGLILPFMSVGATGLVSVLSNVDGALLQEIMQAYEDGEVKKAMNLNKKLQILSKAMFLETNPIPVKAAVTMATGIDAGAPRLPLTEITEENKAKLREILASEGII